MTAGSDSIVASQPLGEDELILRRELPVSDVALSARLDELFKANKLPMYRGTVARSRVEDLLGLPKGVLNTKPVKWQWVTKCIDEFDKVLRAKGHGTVWEEKVPVIREHLESLHKSKKLPINQKGELNRQAILASFNGSKMSAWVAQSRAPLLKDLFDDYSKIVLDGPYSQYKYEYLEEPLKKILAAPDMQITYGRQVGVKSIAKQLGVSRSALRNTPSLAVLIEQKQKEVNLNLRRGLTKKQFVVGGVSYINIGATPWSEEHGRTFDFSDLIEQYGREFAEKIGTIFVHITNKLENPKTYFNRIRHFLHWLAKHDGSSKVVTSLREGNRPDRNLFERSALTYQQSLIAEVHEKSGGGSSQRKNLSLVVITKFGDARVFPTFTFASQKRNRRKVARDRNPKPSLVEAQIQDVEAITRIAADAARYRDIEFDSNKDTIAFANTLATERARRDDLPEGLIEAISFLCEERLYELRKESSTVFRLWHETYQHGRKLISQASHSGKELKSLLDAARPYLRTRAWTNQLAILFPQNNMDLALSNLLALVEYEFHGVCPPSDGSAWGQFWRSTYSKVGGSRFVQSHLLPTSSATSAAVCLYLCESGANSSVGLVLEPNSVRTSKLPNHVNIVSTKARSLGKSIFNDLPAKTGIKEVMSAAEALRILKDATQPLRDGKIIGLDKLLVFASQAQYKNLEEWQLRKEIGDIAEASNILSGLKITPSMIRPTVLLHAQLKHPGNLTVANMVAQHNDESTTMGYVAKLPYRLILEGRIRTFVDTLQVVIANNVNGACTKLGIENKKWNSMVEHSQRTGLGVFCSNPFAGAQADYPSGQKCKAVDRCIECNKILVVAHAESIADMIIWREALDRAQDEWLDTRYQRWEEVWTPWQAFFHVVLNEKMSRGDLAVIKNQAAAIAERRMSSTGFKFPEPW